MADLYPAIDIRGGRCVRLSQGRTDRETVYDADPLEVARGFARAGALWVHVVDLDAAFGEGNNRELVRRIAGETALHVQTGGGIRSAADIDDLLGAGVERVVIGTAAVEEPEMIEEAVGQWGGARVAAGLDARGRSVAVRGWREEGDIDLHEAAVAMVAAGVTTVIHTDIDRDGMLGGPNVEASRELAAAADVRVIVSGGVAGTEDLRAVAKAAAGEPRIAGVIVGKALYEGRIDLEEALEIFV